MNSARHFEPPPEAGQHAAESQCRAHRHSTCDHPPSLGSSGPSFDTASELRAASKTVYCPDECSENVNGSVRKMHDMRNMQI